MAFVLADRVAETSTTTGTGTYNLAGVATGFGSVRTFVAGIGTGNTCFYVAFDDTDWEVGIGTVTDATPDTLARTTVLASSNAGAAVNWAAGTRTIMCSLLAVGLANSNFIGILAPAITTLLNLNSIQGVSFTFGAYAATILNNANEAAFKAAVNLEAGVDYQAFDELLNEIAALSTDPNADSGMFFDDSAGSIQFWTPTAPLAFSGTNLTVAAASTTAAGVSEIATSAEYRTGTDTTRVLGVSETWGAMAEVSLVDGASIALDMASGIDFTVTLAGNRALANPTNEKVGKSGRIRVVQDGTGTRTLSFGTDYEFAGGVAIVLSTAINDQDILYYDTIATDRVVISAVKDIS